MGMRKTIYVVDDTDTNLAMAEQALGKQYRVFTLPSAAKMFAFLTKIVPDMILLDIEMPEMGGFEALRRLKADARYANIPVIFLTGITETSIEAQGFEFGAVDFVGKPFSVPVLNNRISTHLRIDESIRTRTEQLQRLQSGIVQALADIVEYRDQSTGEQADHTAIYVETLITAMIQRGVYANEIGVMNLESLVSSARLHDIGKISIPDNVLKKPGKLTDAEYEKVKSHTHEGERIIDQIASRTKNVDFLRNARLFAGGHHERWDGNGYPRGLRGAEIPIQCRIMAVIDVYSALISERPYKKPFNEDDAIRIIMDSAGSQFDPMITSVFVGITDHLSAARKKQADNAAYSNVAASENFNIKA